MNIEQDTDGQNLGMIPDWELRSKGLREQFPLLTEEDIFYKEGCENELICRIGTRLNMNSVEVIFLVRKNLIVVAEPK